MKNTTTLAVCIFGIVILSLLLITYYNDTLLQNDYVIWIYSLVPIGAMVFMIHQLENKCIQK